MYRLVFFFSFLFLIVTLQAQELKCMVNVTTPQIQSSDKDIYTKMQTAIFEFMNNRKWSSFSYDTQEKIECSILINITDRNANLFTATIQVQSRRPIYNTSYNAVLLNYIDKDFSFEYEEDQPLDFTESSDMSNLTSVLAYYAYLIVGMDLDSYQLNGGDVSHRKTQTIVSNTQQSSYKGWKSFENQKNRYWIAENRLNPSYSGLASAVYKYHRLGLDVMYDSPDKGREQILKGMEDLLAIKRQRSGLINVNMFITAKRDEIIQIFSQASDTQKQRIVQICTEIDPTGSAEYKKIVSK